MRNCSIRPPLQIPVPLTHAAFFEALCHGVQHEPFVSAPHGGYEKLFGTVAADPVDHRLRREKSDTVDYEIEVLLQRKGLKTACTV